MGYRTGILLGQIIKTNGFEGSVVVKLEKRFIENIPEMESVFLETDGRPVPFFIEWSEYTGSDILRLKFDGYDSLQKVEEFRGCKVFLTDIFEEVQPEDDYQILTGFSVFDRGEKKIGVIKEIIVNPGQVLLSVESPQGNEILIPMHEDLIVGINDAGKTITMDIPEGLIEINS